MDLKGMYQEKADEIAENEYGQEFYDLPKDTQYAVFVRAEEEVHERLQSQADSLRKEIGRF